MADEPEKLKVTKPATTAAGLKAIWHTAEQVFGKMGVARGARAMLKINQKGGFDCQSCAWPDPDERRTMAEFCENGAKAMADEGTTKRIDREFFAKHSIDDLDSREEQWLNAQGRLTEPVILREGSKHYEPISWEDAFRLIADELNSLASPDESVFYTSGRTSNEAAFLYQLFVRQFGTNNLPDCSNMCHESSSVALSDSIGLGKATVRLEDFEQTDLIIVIGQNPGTNAPRMMTSLQAAKKAGAKMIAINPLAEAGLMNFVDPNPQHGNPLMFPFTVLGLIPTELSDLHLPVRVGGDMAVLKGIMKTMLEAERIRPGTVFDRQFIDEYTSGFDELIASLDAADWGDILAGSGLSLEQISKAAEMIMSADRIITCWAMGITQHKHAVATIQDIVNLHLLRGQIGKEGAGLCPVRGHSNVQGDRTMGIWDKMTPVFRQNLEREFRFTTPEKDGFNTVESILAMHDGRAKFFFAMGGNFVASSPDTEFVSAALRKCRLTVQVLTKLNRSAVTCGRRALILPCLGRSEVDVQPQAETRPVGSVSLEPKEQFVSTESTMLNVQMSKGIFPPASEHLRSEPWMVCRMAKAVLGDKTTVDWDAMAADYDNIRDAISRVVPGFEDYNDRIRVNGGFYLPSKPRQREFPTSTGKANFRAHTLETIEVGEGRLLLTTIRSHNQFNTTVYDDNDRYRGIKGGRRVIFLNPDDMSDLGLKAGQIVDLTSHFQDEERHAPRFAVVPYEIPKGCAAAYFPEANPLVPVGSYAEKSATPTSKSIVISIQPTPETIGEFKYDYSRESGQP